MALRGQLNQKESFSDLYYGRTTIMYPAIYNWYYSLSNALEELDSDSS